MPTVLLTGMPRSGTTLACSILNDFPDTVALAEPLTLDRRGDRSGAIREIDQFVAEARELILTTGAAPTKHRDGLMVDNFVEPPTGHGLRNSLASHGTVRVEKPLSRDFHLVIKHPAEFTALWDLLTPRYSLYAIVRNPLAVLAAWQTVNMKVNRGHMKMAEIFLPDLAGQLARTPDVLGRQIILIEWMLGVYAAFPPGHVLRYEDILRAPHMELARLSPNACETDRDLRAYDPGTRYPGVNLSRLARALLPVRHRIERFYPDFEATLHPHLAAAD